MRHIIINTAELNRLDELTRNKLLRFIIVHECFHEHTKFVDEHRNVYIECVMTVNDALLFQSLYRSVISAIYSPIDIEAKSGRSFRVGGILLTEAGPLHINKLLVHYKAHEALEILKNPVEVTELYNS